MKQEERKLPSDLDEAANKWGLENQEGFCTQSMKVAAFIAGAEWQKELMGEQARQALAKTDITLADLVAFDEGFKLGRRLERQNMMKEAVEADVNTYLDLAAGKSWAEFVVEMPTTNLGDKMQIIIVKED